MAILPIRLALTASLPLLTSMIYRSIPFPLFQRSILVVKQERISPLRKGNFLPSNNHVEKEFSESPYREAKEVHGAFGTFWAPEGAPAFNPAFDVTPVKYITSIVLDTG